MGCHTNNIEMPNHKTIGAIPNISDVKVGKKQVLNKTYIIRLKRGKILYEATVTSFVLLGAITLDFVLYQSTTIHENYFDTTLFLVLVLFIFCET